jgi:hypothetical protein
MHACAELRKVKLPGPADLNAWDLICFGPGGDVIAAASTAAASTAAAAAGAGAAQMEQGEEAGASDGQTSSTSPAAAAGAPSERGLQRHAGRLGEREDETFQEGEAQGIDSISGPLLKTVLALDQVRREWEGKRWSGLEARGAEGERRRRG